eukprot:1669928-Rhodomonas_salina.1
MHTTGRDGSGQGDGGEVRGGRGREGGVTLGGAGVGGAVDTGAVHHPLQRPPRPPHRLPSPPRPQHTSVSASGVCTSCTRRDQAQSVCWARTASEDSSVLMAGACERAAG